MSKLFDDAETDRRFRLGQLKVLVGTMIGYTLFYFLRKNLSFAMPGLAQDYGITKTGLGLFLTLHGIVYGLSKYVDGVIGDRSNSRKFRASSSPVLSWVRSPNASTAGTCPSPP